MPRANTSTVERRFEFMDRPPPREHPRLLSEQAQKDIIMKQIAAAAEKSGATVQEWDKGPMEPTDKNPAPTPKAAPMTTDHAPNMMGVPTQPEVPRPAFAPTAHVVPIPPSTTEELPPLEERPAHISDRPPGEFWDGDVVQVNNPKSAHYGMLFIIGAFGDGTVHGYFIGKNRKKEYVTVPEGDIYGFGQSRVKSQQPTSSEWNMNSGGKRTP